MKLRLLLNSFFLLSFTCITVLPLAAQSSEIVSNYEVIIKTRSFSAIEHSEIQNKLTEEGPFTVFATCGEQGLLAIRIPVAASIRKNTIEETIINTTVTVLHSDATVAQNRTLENVVDCDN